MARWVAFLGAVIVVFVGASGVGAGTACACSCVGRSAAEVVSGAGAIVVGTPVEETETDDNETYYTINVAYSYKQAVGNRITIATAPESASCGLPMKLGSERIIVVDNDDDRGTDEHPFWEASLCDNISREPILALAGKRFEPLPQTQVHELPGIPESKGKTIALASVGALALVTLAIIGTVLIRSRRRT